jgi:hypothetical protein
VTNKAASDHLDRHQPARTLLSPEASSCGTARSLPLRS